MDAIEAFLARESEVGRTESEGSFTVSGERALEKLASFQLPRTSAWVLKMLQAGTAGKAAGIWITHGAKSCKFQYRDADFGELEDFERFWAHPSPVVNAGQAHLVVALRTVAFSRKRPVLIGHNSERFGLRSLFWDGRRLSSIEPIAGQFFSRMKIGWPDEGEMVFYIAGSPLGSDGTSARQHGVNEVTASEFKELQTYGVCCPVPVWVESRPLNHFGLQDISMTRKALAFSAQAREDDKGPELMLPPSVVLDDHFPYGSRLAWTLYRSQQPESSRISWVHNGVVCEEGQLQVPRHNFFVRLFVPADDLETDLTALQLRFPSRAERSARTNQAVQHFCAEVAPDQPVVRTIAEALPNRSSSWAASAAVLVGGFLLAPLTSGFSLLAGGAAAVGVGVAEKRASKTRGVPELERFRTYLLNNHRA